MKVRYLLQTAIHVALYGLSIFPCRAELIINAFFAILGGHRGRAELFQSLSYKRVILSAF